MQSLTLPTGQTIRYYSDLDEFPAERRSYLTRYQIEAAEIDLSPEAIADRLGLILQYNAEGRGADVAVSLQNLLFSFNMIRMNYAPDELSFGVLIYDVDGVAVTDLSPEGLHRILKPLQIPLTIIQQVLDDVKKNSQTTESVISLGLQGMLR
ncbi:hypothetical protein [Spirosoma aerolatum]|uniref:hypothetical protein n=1 Tax=Spirosoma aerolatum TaxID=1211326 RepID=UPI0009AE4853|nr:hypothetical protein [Spirosoma aerolatum]